MAGLEIKQLTINDFWPSEQPLQFGQNCANETRLWMTSDTEEHHQEMIKNPDHVKYFHEQGWDRPGAISYRINSDGFRGQNFDSLGSKILTLGCSFTFGIGLPESDAWPYQLASMLHVDVANIAWPGIAADSCVRLASYWIPRLTPMLVVMCTPPPDRFEIFFDSQWSSKHQYSEVDVIMPGSQHPEIKDDRFVKHYYLNSKNSQYNRYRNIMTLKHLCSELGIPCLVYCAYNAFGRSREEVGYARDYLHAGVPGHKMLVERIVNDWNEIKHA